MKRHFILAIVAFFVVSAVSSAVFLNSKSSKNDLFSANVEALVRSEGLGVLCIQSYWTPGSEIRHMCSTCRMSSFGVKVYSYSFCMPY